MAGEAEARKIQPSGNCNEKVLIRKTPASFGKEEKTMAKATKSKQLTFDKENRVGLLADISGALTAATINVTGLCAYHMNDRAYFMVMTDNNAKAKRTLKKIDTQVKEEPVIVVEMLNRVGELEKVSARLAEAGIDIEYTYGTAGAKRSTFCVFKTDKDTKAIKVINK